MKKLYLIILLSSILFGQRLSEYSKQSLFSDYKASQVGDAITILVVESSQASNSAESSSGRNSDLGMNFSGSIDQTQLPNIKGTVGSKNNFTGKGSTKAQGVITTKISATIDSVLPNGNLYIKGSRKLIINGEEQLISISGVVRPIDINSDNTVLSTSISDAEIVFEGSGMIRNNQKPGWITRLFHWLF
ncbi:MAG TPA: flagellar basal body L-ring protein FlgH [Ignavibacteriales bacterium]|nr:flagellar basal body L-ring protein FlgH [Ignavibacteriales bacterium]HOL81290.1 flagellar basal body L-ring protein FlgH [Ignavibacteriales bacterium]HOM66054.1 flagellar basal body L-ring protein FlgH [Ignavibacteriales bacterium]HPD67546.1 flagellar basal body L-ring protein FlgH [Ignavibacteriales bacterium]HPP33400.1 flagellar basal body L-ring protein FlgH [Ignavibacteriales bacterium]